MKTILRTINSARTDLTQRLTSHEFMQRCHYGRCDLLELKCFLLQHGIYNSYSTHYLCALMSNLKGRSDIRALAENLFEQLGFSPLEVRPHSDIYREMLGHFSLSLDGAQPTAGTQKLIDTMFRYCRRNNPAWGLGALCLGAQTLAPTLYTGIIAACRALHIDCEQLEFFEIPPHNDDEHTEALIDIMQRTAKQNPEQLNTMLEAGKTLVDARLDFLSDLADSTQVNTIPAYQTCSEY